MRVVLFVISILFSCVSLAKDFNNGCGSGWNEPIVPDKIITLGVDFRAACAEHDNCYSKCLDGGENYNKPICNQTSEEKKENRRLICDEKFLQDAEDKCANDNVLLRPLCEGVATIYKIAIRTGGKGSFNGDEVPESYYNFIASEEARNFNFSEFEKEIDDVLQTKDVGKSNVIKLNVRNGTPIAEFVSISPMKQKHILKDKGQYSTETLKYGSVDLSKAAVGKSTLKLNNFDLKTMDINKIKIERSFSTTTP